MKGISDHYREEWGRSEEDYGPDPEPPDEAPYVLAVLRDAYDDYLANPAKGIDPDSPTAFLLREALPQLLREAEEAERELVRWRTLPVEDFYLRADSAPGPDVPVTALTRDEAEELAWKEPGKVWVKSVHTAPWTQYIPSPF